MRCEEVQSSILDFIDCELDQTMCQKITEHLNSCQSCRLQHKGWEETIYAIQASKNDEFANEYRSVKENVMNRIQHFENHKTVFKKNIKVWNRLAGIAAAFAILFVGYAGYNDINSSSSQSLPMEQDVSITTVKKGDVVRISSNEQELANMGLSNENVPYSLSGIFFGIGVMSIFMRKKIEKQLENL
ncbi:hypothetical protein BHU72_03970 [Desulfuribacillus stibiiarsenatis]|uniref:Putative zinc-finger domain-containing protein n=2 Tax=Desulfuribacillus stibiiarsenatis TaxID=1390249 RepID=A0A1E5L736_9FIRM|nr:hypothetical protein BHU72_03970 [Desulfuribacillus stibiiarsenatis]